jgi:hypothetical protein
MLFALALFPDKGNSDLPDDPRAGEVEEVKSMIEEAKTKDRAPIGTDWEQD